MQRDIRLLICAAALAGFAVALFAAAGCLYIQLRQVVEVCSYYHLSDAECYASESVRVASVGYEAGIALFSVIGLAVWSTAFLLAYKWKRGDSIDGRTA